MAEQRRTRVLGVTAGHEGNRVTTLELFFDLVFVFAFTQVTALMAHGEPPMSLLHGFIVLSLLWWSWCSYAWLANQARANRGVLHAAFIVAMIAAFVACLAIPEIFHEVAGGLPAAATVVICYAIVRCAHLGVYAVAAGDNRELRRRVALTLATSVLPTLTLLIIGVAVGDPGKTWIWLAAVVYDFAAIFVGARGGGWVVQSPQHFAERHGLVVILALGESIVAIGVGVADVPLDTAIVIGAVLAIAIAIGLWWQYFHRRLELLEHGLANRKGEPRAKLASEIFTYLHFPIIGGVIFAALGIEQAMAHLHDHHLGALGGWALAGGVAATLIASVLTIKRSTGDWLPVPLVAAGVLIAAGTLLATLPPLSSLAFVVAVLTAACLIEELIARRTPATS